MCAPSLAAEKIGIVFMHGEAGAPGRVIVGLTDALEKAGYLVSRPDMCWSARRSYEAQLHRLPEHGRRLDHQAQEPRGDRDRRRRVRSWRQCGHRLRRPPSRLARDHRRRAGARRGKVAARPDIADSIARARALVAAGKGDDEGDFADVNIGPSGLFSAEIATTPAIYLSFFGPNSEASIAGNVAKVSAPLLWVAASDDATEDGGQREVFARAPANAQNRFVTVGGGPLGASNAAKADVLAWLKTLDAR